MTIDLKKIKPSKEDAPMRILLYGPEKVGKSTFAMSAPSPIFVDPAQGTAELELARYQPSTWDEILEVVTELRTQDHDFKTLVLDEMGHIEQLAHQHVLKKYNKSSIAIGDLDYGKGYVASYEQFRILQRDLELLRKVKGMHVIFLAHSEIKPFSGPEGERYDRYQPQLDKRIVGILKQWCDAILFARYETETAKVKGKEVGITTGARIIHTLHEASWDAGNRYDLPDQLPMDWDEFIKSKGAATMSSEEIVSELGELELAEEDREYVNRAIKKLGKDTAKMRKVLDWARGKVRTG